MLIPSEALLKWPSRCRMLKWPRTSWIPLMISSSNNNKNHLLLKLSSFLPRTSNSSRVSRTNQKCKSKILTLKLNNKISPYNKHSKWINNKCSNCRINRFNQAHPHSKINNSNKWLNFKVVEPPTTTCTPRCTKLTTSWRVMEPNNSIPVPLFLRPSRVLTKEETSLPKPIYRLCPLKASLTKGTNSSLHLRTPCSTTRTNSKSPKGRIWATRTILILGPWLSNSSSKLLIHNRWRMDKSNLQFSNNSNNLNSLWRTTWAK